MAKVVNGIQQIGIGVTDARAVFNWYKNNLGFDILIFEDEATAHLMLRYTNGVPRARYALLSMNMHGGGGLEIWESTSDKPRLPENPIQLGDLGINAMKIRAIDLVSLHRQLTSGLVTELSGICSPGLGRSQFFFTDPWGNRVQIVEDTYVFSRSVSGAGGVMGAIIGVSDMQVALDFYGKILGYDQLVFDHTGTFDEFADLPGGKGLFRKVVIKQGKRVGGGFGKLLGPTELELLQVMDRKAMPIFKDRLWGDLGFIHLCFDIHGMEEFRLACRRLGYPFTVDSTDGFDMGDASGRFSYVEDPDGTLIELVETHKVPLFRKFGIYIDLKKRDPKKPLPRWLVMIMKIHRRKKDLP